MATTSTDPRDIEADLERERAALADTLDTLSDRVSVDNLAKEALGMLKSNAGYATSTLDHAVRANPLAMALIGAGLAWMFVGPMVSGKSSSSSSSSDRSRSRSSAYLGGSPTYDEGSGYASGTYAGGSSGSYGSSGSASPAAYGSGSAASSYGSTSRAYGTTSSGYAGGSTGSGYAGGSTGAYGGGMSSDTSSDYGRVGYVPSDNDEDHAWSREAHGLRARASEALRRLESEAKSYYDSIKGGISNMTSGSSSSGERDFEAERQGVISRFSSDLKARLSAGLDNLPPESRDRVIAAREQAYRAMLQAEQMGRDAWRNPGRVMEEHPFVAGAVAFALGATTAALLPSTEVENRTFGAERDRLMNDAARLLREERGRAMQLAGSLGQEIKSAAQETVGAVADTVKEKASEAANRLGDRVTERQPNSDGSGETGTTSPGLAGPGDPVVR